MNVTAINARATQSVQTSSLTDAMKRVVAFIFSEKVSLIVACAIVAVMWWHIISIDNTIAMQRTIAFDCLALAPWGIAWFLRSLSRNAKKEGGQL